MHQQIIWAKARGVLTHSHYLWSHEPCFCGWIEGQPPSRKPPSNERTVWQLDQQGASMNIHPFLFDMCQQLKFKVLERQKYSWTRANLIASKLKVLLRDQVLHDQSIWGVSMELPYPLDRKTAAAVSDAQNHHVLTWEVLEEGDDLVDW